MTITERQKIALLTRSYQSGAITWQALREELYALDDKNDSLISRLLDLIEHEPQRGGTWGVTEKDWKAYQQQIAIVLLQLEA